MTRYATVSVILAVLGLLACGGSSTSGAGGSTSSGGKAANTGGSASGGHTAGSGGQDQAQGGKNGGAGAGGNGGTASGGTASGGTASGGTPGSGGTASGGSTGAPAGGSSGGATSQTGGSSATGGVAKTGGSSSGGTTGTGGIGGAAGAGGSAPSTAIPSKGCSKTATLSFTTVPNEDANATPGGPKQGTGKGGWVTMPGGRGFALRLPDNYDNNHPYWLIFGFHGNGMNAASVDNGGDNGYFTAYWGLQRESKNGAFFVAPEWNGGGWGTGDLTYTDDMVKLISENYCIDMSNIIASGFSYGGGMTHTIACNRASTSSNPVGYKFRAALMMEACSFLVSGSCPGKDPIDVWQMAGLTDGVCGFDDSKTVRNWFVDRNGCTEWKSETGNVAASTTGAASKEPPTPPTPGKYINPGGHLCTNYTCSTGAVRWCANQSGHGTAVVDGTDSLYDTCANRTSQYPQGNCTPGCPCTWTPDDMWNWLNDPTYNKYTPNITIN